MVRALSLTFFCEAALRAEHPSHEWGEFLHLPRRKFFDFDEVRNEPLQCMSLHHLSFDQIRNEIKLETERVTGKNKVQAQHF